MEATHRQPIGWFLVRCGVLVVFFFLWYRIYAVLNAIGSERCVFWDAPGIYQPWAVYLYVFGAAVVALLPFLVHRTPRSFFNILGAYALTSAVFFTIYWLFPVCMARPEFGASTVADRLMRIVVGLDQPANCFPSSHCMFATMGFLGVRKSRVGRGIAWLVGMLSVGVCASTVLVGQHYVIDVFAGVALAALVFTIAGRWIPGGPERPAPQQVDPDLVRRWRGLWASETVESEAGAAAIRTVAAGGRKIPVTLSDGTRWPMLIPPHQVITVDATDRRVVIVSDLHFFGNRLATSARKLEALERLFAEEPGTLVVFGGDVFEIQVAGWKRIERLRSSGHRPDGTRQSRSFAALCDRLRGPDAVLIPGNHDPWNWYEQLDHAGDLTGRRVRRLRLETRRGAVLVAHGHEVFMDHDQVRWGGIRQVSPLLIRLFFYFEGLGYTVLGRVFLRWIYAHINTAFRMALGELRNAFEVERVVLGHSHLGESDPASGLFVTGFCQHGRLDAVVLDRSGRIEHRTLWYNNAARGCFRIRRRLGLERGGPDGNGA